ncbi:MAG: carbohydrate kinase family protein [Actinomycetota bacterium]
MSILVTGSIAFDNIMDFDGHFKDHILPEKVHVLSVSFLVDTLKRQHGGAAANISYNLALLGEHPCILAAVGDDFAEYRAWLESHGVDCQSIRVVPGEWTASAFITNDRDNNQITGFYPGAMRGAAGLSLDKVDGDVGLAVVSPDDPAAMARYPAECRERGIPYVYSPGQQIVALSSESLLDGLKGARCVIGNDYEMQMIAEKTGMPTEEFLNHAEVAVTTMGEGGSIIETADGRIELPAAAAVRVVDPTGAGDAYVAGVARGLMRDEPPEVYGRVAAMAGTYAVENYGTQGHSYSMEGFATRYREAFGQELP